MPPLQSSIFFGYIVVCWIYIVATLWNHPSLE